MQIELDFDQLAELERLVRKELIEWEGIDFDDRPLLYALRTKLSNAVAVELMQQEQQGKDDD